MGHLCRTLLSVLISDTVVHGKRTLVVGAEALEIEARDEMVSPGPVHFASRIFPPTLRQATKLGA